MLVRMKKNYYGAGERAQPLKARSDQVQFAVPVLGSPQPPLTPAPREPGPLVLVCFSIQVHIHTQ